MAYLNIKELEAELKKGSFRRIYYIFGGDKAGVETATRKIVKAAVGGNEEFALTKLDGKRFDISQLEELVGQFNMMSEYNCILINDYNCEKPREDMRGKKAEDINTVLKARHIMVKALKVKQLNKAGLFRQISEGENK